MFRAPTECWELRHPEVEGTSCVHKEHCPGEEKGTKPLHRVMASHLQVAACGRWSKDSREPFPEELTLEGGASGPRDVISAGEK